MSKNDFLNLLKPNPLRVLLFFVFLAFFIAPCSAMCCPLGCVVLIWPMAMMGHFVSEFIESSTIIFILSVLVNLIYLYLFSCFIASIIDYARKRHHMSQKASSKIWILVVAVIIVAAGVLVWQQLQVPAEEEQPSGEEAEAPKEEAQPPADETAEDVHSPKVVRYIPQVLIKGKWGIQPGEFGMAMFEGSPLFPKSLVVDSSGDIFILDSFNNRIQKFNKEGKYITSIPVESYRRSTKEEVDESKNTWNKLGFDFLTIYAQELYIDLTDNLYLEQETRDTSGQVYKRFFKYTNTKINQGMEIEQSEFEKVKEQTQPGQLFVESKDERYLIELEDSRKGEQNIRIHNLRTNQIQLIPFEFQYPATKIDFIKVDTDNRIYVFTGWPPQIHKYDLEGNLLSLIDLEGLPNPYGDHPILNSIPYIDSDGNVYQMELIPNPDKQIEHFPAYSLGLKIIKWRLENRYSENSS